MKTKFISLKYDDMYRGVFAYESIRKQFLSDVLEIPLESIRTARLVTPHLWRRYRSQKLGILDFKLLEGEDYHSVYRLRNEKGEDLTRLWEVHIIELGKRLQGNRLDGWIQLFNAKSWEELDMLTAKYKGLTEAAEAMKRMSLGKALRYRYEEHLKAVRDRYGEDEYVRDQGRTEGIAIGKAEGIAAGRAEAVLQLLADLGEIPGTLEKQIQAEADLQVLSRWLKAAAKAESIAEFEKQM